MALPSGYGPSISGEESAEALRRRADVLLDEMMLGGVDTMSAGPQPGHYTGNGPANGRDRWSETAEVGPEYDGSGYGPNGAGSDFDAHPTAQSGPQDANGYHAAPNSSAFQSEPTASGTQASSPAPGPRLVSAEQRYAQLAGAQPPVEPDPAAGAARPVEPTRTQLHAQAEPRPQEWSAERTAAGAMSGAMSGTVPGANSAVRRQSPSLASTMSVGVRGANRSNLLPRNNEIDVNTVQQEINDLLGALNKVLPPGSEAVERSRHLLHKAQSLLESDPTRTAEVDYYLQQVRRSVQRARQTQQWSSLYHRRLNAYLGAWLLLSALVVAASALYAVPLAGWLNQTFDLPNWWMVMQQGPLLLAGAFAGSLGASLSVLWHVQQHAAREYGYFDRKYGLRGLLLPLLGWLLGLLLALVWAGVYLVVGLDPVLYAWAIAAPAVLAFLIGFSQQWLYGAR